MTGQSPNILPLRKVDVLAEIHQARQELEQLIQPLSAEQLAAQGPDRSWSVLDHLSHLAAWEEGIAALLRKKPRFVVMGVEEAVLDGATQDEVNAILHMRDQDCTPDQVLERFARAHQDLLAALEPLQDADLLRTYSFYQPDEPGEDSGEPIVRWVLSNTSRHFREHIGWIEDLLAALKG